MKDLLVGIDVNTIPEFNSSYDYFVSNNIRYAIIEGMCDIHFNDFGELMTTEGEVKLSQNVVANILIPQSAIETAEDIGSNLNNYIGKKINNGLLADISDDIIRTITSMNDYAEDNYDYNEYIYSIDYIDIKNDDREPRQINVYIGLTTQDKTTFDVFTFLG